MHKEEPLRRFAALSYLSMWKNKAWTLHCRWLSPSKQAAGRFVPDAASERQAALISTVGLYASTVCESVSVLFDVRRYTVSPRCLTPNQGCVLRNPPPCHPHLHAGFLHPKLSEGPTMSTQNFHSESLQVLKSLKRFSFPISSFKKPDFLSQNVHVEWNEITYAENVEFVCTRMSLNLFNPHVLIIRNHVFLLLQHYIKLKFCKWIILYSSLQKSAWHVQLTWGFIDNLLQDLCMILAADSFHGSAGMWGIRWANEAGLLCQRWFGLLSGVNLQICCRPELTALIEQES